MRLSSDDDAAPEVSTGDSVMLALTPGYLKSIGLVAKTESSPQAVINEQMKMSTDEIKRELRESEGDPMLKGRRKARMRELAKRRISTAVATADVIVVNPTHYAVALRYDEAKDRAPIVVAKGVDELAALHAQHRSTVFRRLEKARMRVFKGTKKILLARGLSADGCASMLRQARTWSSMLPFP